MTFNLLGVFFLFFLTSEVGIPPHLAGLILFIANSGNALGTLLVGVLSDRTQSALGRRRVWMLWSTPIFAISFILHWWVPPLAAGWQFSYFLGIAVLHQLAVVSFLVPYSALLTDMTEDESEHLKLNGWRFTFTLAGSIGSLLLMQGLAFWPYSQTQQLQILGCLCAGLTVISVLWCCYKTAEQPRAAIAAPQFNWQEFREMGQNRPLMLLIGIFALSWTSVQITPAILPYFLVNNLQLSTDAIPSVILTIKGATLAGLFLWEPLSRRLSKKIALLSGTTLWAIVNFSLFYVSPGQAAPIYIYAAVAGLGMGASYLVPPAMLPEIIDCYELQTGRRRDGLFNSLVLFMTKVSQALALFTFGQILSYSGFRESLPSSEQPESALWAIRELVVLLPSIALACGLVLSFFYPIDRALHQQTIQRLQQRRRAIATDSVRPST